MYVATFGAVLSLVIPALGQIVSCKFGFKRTDDLILTVLPSPSFIVKKQGVVSDVFLLEIVYK